jgi:hypothetical protein
MIFTPLYPWPPFIHDRTMSSIVGMRWGHQLEIVLGKHDAKRWPRPDEANRSITEKYETARKMALALGLDAILTVEADMVVPEIALARMWEVEADVVYGLYVSRHGKHPWLALRRIAGRDERYRADSLSNHPEVCLASWGRVIETEGVGMGCTLIRKTALETIPFRCPDTSVANDWHFALDVKAAGLRQVHDLGTVCGHITRDGVLWPEPDGGWRYE